MRTTIELPVSMLRQLNAMAAQRGLSVDDLVRSAVEAIISRSEKQASHRVNFPVVRSNQPGTLNLSNADIDELLT